MCHPDHQGAGDSCLCDFSMTNKTPLFVATLFTSLLVFFSFSKSLLATVIGKVVPTEPTVIVQRDGGDRTIGLQGTIIQDGDVVYTDKTGTAKIMLFGGNVLFLSPSTTLRINSSVDNQGKKIFTLAFTGKTLARIKKPSWKAFKIKTRDSEVEVLGNSFIVENQGEFTKVAVLEGMVKLRDMKTGLVIPVSEGKSAETGKAKQEILETNEEIYDNLEFSQAIPQKKEDEEAKLLEELARLEALEQEKERKRLEEERLKEQEAKLAEPVEEVEEDEPSIFGEIYQKYEPDLPLHITALSTMVISAWLSMEESKKYQSLSDENSSLKSKASTTTDDDEYSRLNTEFKVNQEKMTQHKKNINLYNLITIASLAFETWLILYPSGAENEEEALSLSLPGEWQLKPQLKPIRQQLGVKLERKF